jgi:hypothetical protein
MIKDPRGPASLANSLPAKKASAAISEDFDIKVFEGRTCSLREAALWVADHIGFFSSTGPEDAPGPLAWNLLCWATKHKHDFFKAFLPKFAPTKSIQTDKEEKVQENKEQDVNLTELLQTSRAKLNGDGG